MAIFDLDSFLPYRLSVLAGKVSKGFARCYGQSFDLSIPEWRVMAHLSQADAVSVREIHERVDMDKSKASRAATKLEEAGVISKRAGTGDKRLIELSLTAKGKDMMTSLAKLAHDYEQNLLAPLSPSERQEVDRALSILETRLMIDVSENLLKSD